MCKLFATVIALGLLIQCSGSTIVTSNQSVKTFQFEFKGSAQGTMSKTSNGLEKDVSSTSEGTGGGSVSSINDTASVSCTFSFDGTPDSDGVVVRYTTLGDPTLEGGGDGVQIVSGALENDYVQSSKCADPTACVLCKTTSGGGYCTVSCTGNIPSNTQTNGDTFNLYLTQSNTFTTDASYAEGMILFSGIIDTAGNHPWSEFNFSSQTNHPTMSTVATNYAGCNGTGSPGSLQAYTGSGSLNDALSIASVESTWFIEDPAIISLGNGQCVVTHEFKAVMPLTGAATQGNQIGIYRDPVFLKATICDTVNAATCH
ncbi:MAG: hypothetical protein WCK49_01630 [Myxococcaceae bacterium]